MQTQLAISSTEFGSAFFDSRRQAVPSGNIHHDPLDAIGTVVALRCGSGLYAEGDAANALYRVSSGVLRTYKLLPDGRRQIDDFLFAGDFFGLEAGAEHSFAAEAVTQASIIRYSRGRLDMLAASDPKLGARLLQLTLKQLDKAHDRLLLLGRKTAEEKLASFLLEMLDRSSGKDWIELSMSRTDIADYLGLTIETVSRTFSAFRQGRVIALPSSHRVVVVDRQALEETTGDA